jgi:hypothetical protein
VDGQGDCYEMNKCFCQNDWEGVACQIRKGKAVFEMLTTQIHDCCELGREDSIEIAFEKIGPINEDNIPSEVISGLTALIDLGTKKFVYRSHTTNPETNVVTVKVSIQEANDVFVEGSALQAIASLLVNAKMTTEYLSQKSSTFVEAPKGYLKPNDTGATLLYLFDGIAFLLCLTVSILLWVHRKKRMIKNVLPSIAILMIVGLMCVQIGVLFYIGLPTTTSCILRKVFIDIGFAIFFG